MQKRKKTPATRSAIAALRLSPALLIAVATVAGWKALQ